MSGELEAAGAEGGDELVEQASRVVLGLVGLGLDRLRWLIDPAGGTAPDPRRLPGLLPWSALGLGLAVQRRTVRVVRGRLLAAVHNSRMRTGEWRLLECEGWSDNATYRALLAWCWSGDAGRHVIVVNLSDLLAQGRIRLPWTELGGHTWQLTGLLNGVSYERDGGELLGPGLYTALDSWGSHLFTLGTAGAS